MTNGPVPEQTQPTNEVHGVFVGPIDQLCVGRIANALAVASSNKVTHIHLGVQTAGGTVADGVALYNLFSASTIPLTVYNIGSISSAGVIAYLGAPDRAASAFSTFMIHRTTSPAFAFTADRLHAVTHSVALDDGRTDAIFAAAGLNLTKEQKEIHRIADLWLSAEEAIAANLATEIKEFAPPKGIQLFFLGSI